MTGLDINYDKSTIILVNCSEVEVRWIRRAMGYNVGELPDAVFYKPQISANSEEPLWKRVVESCYDVEPNTYVGEHKCNKSNGPWKDIADIWRKRKYLRVYAKKGGESVWKMGKKQDFGKTGGSGKRL
ncbi:hypothetical protein PIB30_088508 [Stylosanthes scabra]|uniref:Uncharacterized protein n=1 Tax=Stylosanthes scabra TaxID=79078 RepID=A0ABU6ZSC2_9FABA|nr:hypothetical protein [Stylosanthes scabra]